MSVLLNDDEYKIVRNDDPSYQAMTRVSDANNIYDIKQTYVKNSERNDFEVPLETWNGNKGMLNDGKYINMSDFFMDVVKTQHNGKDFLKGIKIPYFRFKTNAILDYRNGARVAGTYIDKTKQESIYSLASIDIVNPDGDVSTVFGYDEKTLIENVYNSYPLQRVDKLVVYDLASLFLYLNGRKIPDNEVFVYTNKSFTDVFIPMKYLGNIEDSEFETQVDINIDYRQAGSEELYFRDEKLSGSKVIIDLNDPQFDYVDSIHKKFVKDQVIVFINGYLHKIDDFVLEDGVLTVTLDSSYSEADVELYILNNIVYRSTPEDGKLLNKAENKLHFYLNDDYITDVLCGPITKSAVSFFYDKKRIDDSLITQTSRFSFEFAINIADYDPSKVDFFIEDINWRISDISYKTYGDDYYLLNMLGVKRCVDKMRGYKSYSVFDEDFYKDLGFKQTLSEKGDLFNIIKAEEKYRNLDYAINDPSMRVKSLIKERPTLLRKLLEQFKIPTKRMLVVGNSKDVVVSSVNKITDIKQEVYYKIYVNHFLISTADYTVERDLDHDVITISKDVLRPENDETQLRDFGESVNEIEIFQYDMSHKDRCIWCDNIQTGGFELKIEDNGDLSYIKTYSLDELPFGRAFLSEDLCAIEKVAKKWYDSSCPEYYLVYPSDEYYGYRMVRTFKILSRTENEITIKIQLHDYENNHTNGKFFILLKQYNLVEELFITNEDLSYMIDNDLAKPIYSQFKEYGVDENGKRYVKEIHDFIPYINNSEPIVQQNGRELVYGDKYTFINPETNNAVACSFLMLKSQPKVDDVFSIMFNSNKTNILVVGYDHLNINNRFGLLYFSELKYPISTEYMNIIINGEKLSAYDIDILSDKLIRVHHIYRPITSVLITTNSKFKDSEIQDYINLYKESEFEKKLEHMFHNCDPSKEYDATYPVIDFLYKVDPYYSEFVGDEGHDYKNQYYQEYIDFIYEHENEFDKNSIWELVQEEPDEYNEPEKHEAWVNAGNFFTVYKWNHGFVSPVDSVFQRENPELGGRVQYSSDTLVVLYLNWLARSKKTRTYGFKADDIDPIVLKYFSIYQNTLVDNRLDIVVDSEKDYDGLLYTVNEIQRVYYDERGYVKKVVDQYPGSNIHFRRRFFYNMLQNALNQKRYENPNDDFSYAFNPDKDDQNILKDIAKQRDANILYPKDFPAEPDKNGIYWTGSDKDIVLNP